MGRGQSIGTCLSPKAGELGVDSRFHYFANIKSTI